MARQIFVNLPVIDLERTTSFYTQLGFPTNPQFSGQFATCIVISDTIFVMLIAARFFATFTMFPVADASELTESIHALSADSREEVDRIFACAIAAGGHAARAADDYALMYSRAFHDPDGHLWELLYMDPREQQQG
ncbi:MAG: glyoxalase [Chloroflexi bacterium]|nr:glyoxalase [Chloroflexota bacterium]